MYNVGSNSVLGDDHTRQPREQSQGREGHVGQALRHPLLCEYKSGQKFTFNCAK